MPIITRIAETKRTPNRRSVHLDGSFAFACNINVVARFRLREGMTLSEQQVQAIQQGEVRQECFDKAMSFLQSRLHSRAELRRKLLRHEFAAILIDEVLEELARLGYVDDARFAKTKALSASQHKHHGRRRAFMELLKSGVKGDVAERALDDVYHQTDSVANARLLAQKQAARLKRLDPVVARRRLVGMLQRRGFDYETIKPIIEEMLGDGDKT
jgi:regulatory protein